MADNEKYASNLLTDYMYDNINVLDYKSCWLWNGTLNKEGYGVTARTIKGKGYGSLIHRISWYLLYGKIGDGMVINHTCHNPATCVNGVECEHRRCFNPYHLESTSIASNNRSGAANRINVGTCGNNLHEWVPENITTYTSGKRICKACQKAQIQRKKERATKK